MDTTIENNEDETTTWVNNKIKEFSQTFYNGFENIYDENLVNVIKAKSTSEYIEFEKTVMKQDALLKPGKIPIRLHKPESKVIPAVYFTAVFLIKKSGEALRNLLEDTLFSVKMAEQDNERIKIENEIVLADCAAMAKKMNDMEKEKGDKDLTSGLMIADLENRIRNLEADITAKERIILEKNETINSLWGKINAQEEKVVTSTCNTTNMDVDNNLQKKKKRRNKKRKRTRVQYDKNGTINELKLGLIGDADKDRLEEHFAEKSRDITFYDIPAYWSDREIFAKLHDNVGFVEYMRSKRCYKYKTVRATLRFSKDYEKIYKEGGVNVSLTRNNRQFFIRMFDSRLTYKEVKDKFCWQAIKKLDVDIQNDDAKVIKDFVKDYHAFFGKIIRVKDMRFIILYFNKESQLMSAINESTKKYELGLGLWIKKQDDFIDDNGDLQEVNVRSNNWNKTSRSSGSRMDWEQQSGTYTHAGPSRTHKQWR